ncbi:flavin reductase family protein [Reinekea marinisedimentorum]|uniref:Flavin reductase (DIM6/NTAB) family NADH-FMN oxidoreductase RutF n=1 Tax=Reinekea marinisedimentorum TaxID=230495 RepID=A0A4R3I7J8_9GAMM|nr:flavin reductase family protein [Reinekea marinisedimentorum]TCS41157.1 flavin reductase (DIM6/NTAB) family NADH-FMN oxidoreductase RutF [Reinekea marinisedimentorum]
MFIKTDNIETPNIYQLLTNGIVPRPIAWVSTLSKDGTSNLAPYSFFSVASVNPPVLTVTAVPARDKPVKDTLQNLMDTGEAVVHIVTDDFADQMNDSCKAFPADTSEIDALQITTVASELVAPPSIAGSKIRYECKLREVLNVTPTPGGGMLIMLDVLGVFVDDAVSEGSKINPSKINVLGKLGGNDYSDTAVKAVLLRPEG